MNDIKNKIDALKIKDYRKIIETIDAKVDRFTNIKKACEKANVSYRLYYTARSFLAKYDKPIEITKVFKNKQQYSLSKEETEKKKKEEIIELMNAMEGKYNGECEVLNETELDKFKKKDNDKSSEYKNKKNDKITKIRAEDDNENKIEKKSKNNGLTSIYKILKPEHTNFN